MLYTDQTLLDGVLEPYKENCRYLKTARVERGVVEDAALAAHCTFEIPESCYIADTGHFNSVEFNICYNQMAYYLIAKSVEASLVEPFVSWHMEDYWERQLPNILIADFRSKFRSPMRSSSFSGTLQFVKVTQRSGDRPLVLIDTVCRYADAAGGRAEGAVKLVITNPPPRP
ncbi:FcoT family thioesterase [Streptomyces sp. NPDC058198]|uniref:FcoT family thioesterase n=1 Tax=Streptomyces sp. NPDC058198 TaxID=3346377 RepID=UPI0036E38382